jgi:hypothetical protein
MYAMKIRGSSLMERDLVGTGLVCLDTMLTLELLKKNCGEVVEDKVDECKNDISGVTEVIFGNICDDGCI